jgi:predicted N-acetyltransferase YhbS
VSFHIIDLRERPEVLPTLAHMLYEEFWRDVADVSPDSLADRLRLALTDAGLPLCLVALAGDTPVGLVNVIDYDDPNPRVGTPWLAGLVVDPAWRGQGVGSELVRQALSHAKRCGEQQLFLGTDGPGFYRRLGAEVVQQTRDDFWIMRIG